MSRWDKLYDKARGAVQNQHDTARHERLAEDARRALDDWYIRSTEQVMQEILETAGARAEEFEKKTGCAVDILYPDHPSIRTPEPAMSFMRFSLGSTILHLYAVRVPGRSPRLHFARTADNLRPASAQEGDSGQSPISGRLVSTPVCSVSRGRAGEWVLKKAHDSEGGVVSVEAIVFEAFERLVEEYRAQNARTKRRAPSKRPPKD